MMNELLVGSESTRSEHRNSASVPSNFASLIRGPIPGIIERINDSFEQDSLLWLRIDGRIQKPGVTKGKETNSRQY
jgi:hypothetical protein